MARRRAGETPTQNADRQAHVAHRAFSKVCDQPRTQIAVKNWLARALEDHEGRFPHVFTAKGQARWGANYRKEALARRQMTSDPKPMNEQQSAGTNSRAPPPSIQENATQTSNNKPTVTGDAADDARDNAVTDDK